MALRARIITDPNEVLRIINNMSDSEQLSDDDDCGRGIDVLALGLGLLSDQLLEGGVVMVVVVGVGVVVVVVVVVAEEWQEDQHWTVPIAEIVVEKTPFPPDRTLSIYWSSWSNISAKHSTR